MQILATTCFIIALLHTFLIKPIHQITNKFSRDTILGKFINIFGEVELAFAIWALIFIICYMSLSVSRATEYLNSVSFVEPLFVFSIMLVASTEPILECSRFIIYYLSKIIPGNKAIAFYIATMSFGPLLGSLITEPAAMTVTALILSEVYFHKHTSKRFKYLTMGLLFVNVSIGGALTSFAAPPIVMVAKKWGWDSKYLFTQFGEAAILAVFLNTFLIANILKNEIHYPEKQVKNYSTFERPLWDIVLHIILVSCLVYYSHYPQVFLFLTCITIAYSKIKNRRMILKESIMVGAFLSGLVILGGLQNWWLEPFIAKLSSIQIYFASTILTMFVDNAALTYLGTFISTLDESMKKYLVTGAIVGGGMTIVANAPNPVGFSILRDQLGNDDFSPLEWAKAALLPTIVALIIFWVWHEL